MWVLFVILLGASPSVRMHDFDNRLGCEHAAELTRAALKGQGIVYCVEREHSILGPHDDLPLN